MVHMTLRPLDDSVRVRDVVPDLIRGRHFIVDNDLSMFHEKQANLDDLHRFGYRQAEVIVQGQAFEVDLDDLYGRRRGWLAAQALKN